MPHWRNFTRKPKPHSCKLFGSADPDRMVHGLIPILLSETSPGGIGWGLAQHPVTKEYWIAFGDNLGGETYYSGERAYDGHGRGWTRMRGSYDSVPRPGDSFLLIEARIAAGQEIERINRELGFNVVSWR